jgi:hypothetical protein
VVDTLWLQVDGDNFSDVEGQEQRLKNSTVGIPTQFSRSEIPYNTLIVLKVELLDKEPLYDQFDNLHTFQQIVHFPIDTLFDQTILETPQIRSITPKPAKLLKFDRGWIG